MNGYKIRRLFIERGYKIHRVFGRKHHRVEISRDGGPRIVITVASSPSCPFEGRLDQALRRLEREAASRQRA